MFEVVKNFPLFMLQELSNSLESHDSALLELHMVRAENSFLRGQVFFFTFLISKYYVQTTSIAFYFVVIRIWPKPSSWQQHRIGLLLSVMKRRSNPCFWPMEQKQQKNHLRNPLSQKMRKAQKIVRMMNRYHRNKILNFTYLLQRQKQENFQQANQYASLLSSPVAAGKASGLVSSKADSRF